MIAVLERDHVPAVSVDKTERECMLPVAQYKAAQDTNLGFLVGLTKSSILHK